MFQVALNTLAKKRRKTTFMKFTKSITRAAVVAALYIVLTFVFSLTSFSTQAIQFRPSEALMILPLLMWEAVPGLWIGCMLANIMGGSVLDIFFGSFATLLAAAMTWGIGRLVKNTPLRLTLGVIPPVVVNTLLVPMTFTIFIGLPAVYWIEALNVLIGEAVVVIAIGIPLYFGLRPVVARLYGAHPKKKKDEPLKDPVSKERTDI